MATTGVTERLVPVESLCPKCAGRIEVSLYLIMATQIAFTNQCRCMDNLSQVFGLGI